MIYTNTTEFPRRRVYVTLVHADAVKFSDYWCGRTIKVQKPWLGITKYFVFI